MNHFRGQEDIHKISQLSQAQPSKGIHLATKDTATSSSSLASLAPKPVGWMMCFLLMSIVPVQKLCVFGPGKKTHGFKTNKAPPRMEHLNPFENDLYHLVCNIQFSPRRNDFQKQLTKYVKEITSSPNVLVPAAKTINIYITSKDTHTQLLNNNITKSYKKTDDVTKLWVDREATAITTKLGLTDRMEVYAER